MNEERAIPGASKLDPLRKFLFGERLDVLERRIEILATNLQKEVAGARNEFMRHCESLEQRLDALAPSWAGERNALGTALAKEIVERFESEREKDAAQREVQRQVESRRVDDLVGGIKGELEEAIAAAVGARAELARGLRAQIERLRVAGDENLQGLKHSLRQELTRMRAEMVGAHELAALFENLAQRLDRPPGTKEGSA